MSFDRNRLYELIPTVYRLKDEAIAAATGEEKGPLKAFIELFSEQVNILEENLEQLYDDQFIETCAEWVVPYIGDLVGARDMLALPGASFSERAQVANTLAYRRRKGTASVIEQLANDITGWPANVVEYFQQLATTQYLNHLRPKNKSVTSIRNGMLRELATTPFDPYTHTVDVRSISAGRGKYNIPNIGIHLWRIASHSVTRARAYRVLEGDDRFTFDCLGRDTQLYNYPSNEEEISQLAGIDNVPMPIGRLRLHIFLDRYYGPNGKSIFIHGVPIEQVKVCNLSDNETGGWSNTPVTQVTIDPVLGRIAYPPGTSPGSVYVNYYYGFAGKIGAGEYGRDTLKAEEVTTRIIRVPGDQPTIQLALNELSTTGGIVELTSNNYYIEIPSINVEEGKSITICAAEKKRPVILLNGDITVYGDEHSKVTFDGLLIAGGTIRVPANKPNGFLNELGALHIQYCTLMPAKALVFDNLPGQPIRPRLQVETGGTECHIASSIIGVIRIHENASCFINNSIVDAGAEDEWAYKGLDDVGGKLEIENATVVGRVATTVLNLASNTIFLSRSAADAPVFAQRTQEGCVRFSYVPIGSIVPKKFKCQPESTTNASRLKPIFNSLRFGDANYGQLNDHTAKEILRGADNETEMGAFNHLYQAQRVANLQLKLQEYLRFGLEAGVFFGS